MFAAKDLLLTRPSGSAFISRSLRFRSSASAYLNRTFGTPTTQNTFTFSTWVKRGKLSTLQNLLGVSTNTSIGFPAVDTLVVTCAGVATITTTSVYRDPSAWCHVLYSQTTGAATLYFNGVSVGTSATVSAVFNTAVAHQLGAANTSNYVDGYMAEVNFVDGQALTPTSFGATSATTGVWAPIKYTGTYGANGFHLDFNSYATTAALGTDTSGNGNTWTVNNVSVTAGVTYDSMVDSPTVGATSSNYAVLNPIDVSPSTVSNGNLNIAYATNADTNRAATFGVSSGKWYWETTITAVGGTYSIVGITSGASTATPLGTSSYQYGYISSTGDKFNNNSSVAYGSTYTTADVIGIALDSNAGTLVFYKNNTSQGTAYTGLSGTFFPAFNARNASSIDANFGQRPFSYTPPTGYLALNTYNLPAPSILIGANYMAATTWTGNGTSQTINNSVNGISFAPDLVWAKNRTSAYSNVLIDTIRGATNYIVSNATAAEATNAQVYSAFTSTGFSVGNDLTLNSNTTSVVGWQWKAGGASSSNTNGTITSTVSAGATQGFSVVTYTGNGTLPSTVGHGLGVAPSMVIVKTRNSASYDWNSYHISLGNTQYIALNTTAAASSAASLWNNTTPTSTVFTVNHVAVNTSSNTYVAYCFAAVAGYSAFGKYTGNASTDGTFVFTGFRPRWILIKSSTTTDAWRIYDTSRPGYNVQGGTLLADTTGAETTATELDILGNGFKARVTTTPNAAQTYVYVAFAESPFKNSLAR